MMQPRELYLDLVKRSVTNFIYGPAEPQFDERARLNGTDLPPTAQTMVGMKRLDGLLALVQEALRCRVDGDLVEAGAWRGGVSILMRAILKAHGVTNRVVWVADSFEGMPVPDPNAYPADAGSRLHLIPELIVPLEEVKSNFARYGLLDSQVRFVKGRFRDTLPAAPIDRIAVLCLDGGTYEATRTALESLHPKVSPGGFVVVHDYALEGTRRAIDDYRKANAGAEKIWSTDWSGAYWQRPVWKRPALRDRDAMAERRIGAGKRAAAETRA